MRIRKNKKLSSLIYPQGETVHICRLNQSTWDVTPLPEEAYQFEYEDSFDRNGSIGDSIDVVESGLLKKCCARYSKRSVAIMKVGGGTDIDDNVDDNDNGDDIAIGVAKQFEESNQVALLKSCNKNEAESYDNRLTGGRRGGRARATRKGTSSASISNEFYYYSGFKPSRGRRRVGGDEEVENNNGSVITAQHNSMVSSSSQFDNNEEFDYVNDDDDEEDENGDSGKKRMRKPIKERSLKSLM